MALKRRDIISELIIYDDDNVRPLRFIVHDVVRLALRENGGNRSAASRQLGVSRTTLRRLISDRAPSSFEVASDGTGVRFGPELTGFDSGEAYGYKPR
jgi:hypothetical protein